MEHKDLSAYNILTLKEWRGMQWARKAINRSELEKDRDAEDCSSYFVLEDGEYFKRDGDAQPGRL